MITVGQDTRDYFLVTCDICKREVERLQMVAGKLLIAEGACLTVDWERYEVPINHYVVCENHVFNQETGEWE